MNVSLTGEFTVPRKPEDVYAFLSDPQKFAPLLPDYEGLEMQDDRHFTVRLKVGISHIRGTAAVRMALAAAEKPKSARYEGTGDVPGGSATMTAGFQLVPAGGGTRVNWTGEAKIAGRVISLAGGLLEPLAKKNVQRLIDALQAALA